VWSQAGGTWNSGTATSVTICLTNLNTAPSGNDFTIDDIAARPICSAADSIYLRVINPQTTFTSSIRYGCSQDTADFLATNVGADTPTQYLWSFGDGTNSTVKNPSHVYTTQGLYTVKLVVATSPCADSVQAQVDTRHPLDASFTQSADSFCQGGVVTFANTSQTTIRNGIGPKYFWTFGDGGTDTVENPTHVFTRVGTWPVTLVVRDFVPCTDTARDTVVIDSIPFVRVAISDSSLCEGQAITFTGEYLAENNTGIIWDFGDGTSRSDSVNPVRHGYDAAGVYTVTLTASYRICPDTVARREIIIRPFPSLNIGPDTSICPNGEPILLSAHISGTDGALVHWSTGDTAAALLVRHHGDYWAKADLDGCSSTDSVHIAKDCYLDLPNVFSPNGDGTNDYFWPRQLLSEGIVRFSMTIYNRWGQKVWETTSVNGRGWDGKFNGTDQPTGVYIYLVEAELKNGFTEKYQGNVTLLR
jgi:gliding motility-associated-like protein